MANIINASIESSSHNDQSRRRSIEAVHQEPSHKEYRAVLLGNVALDFPPDEISAAIRETPERLHNVLKQVYRKCYTNENRNVLDEVISMYVEHVCGRRLVNGNSPPLNESLIRHPHSLPQSWANTADQHHSTTAFSVPPAETRVDGQLTRRENDIAQARLEKTHHSVPAVDRPLWPCQLNDGELDQGSFSFAARPSRQPNISPNRLSLPPRTPSLTGRTTPRRQAGILANARSSHLQWSTQRISRLQYEPPDLQGLRNGEAAASPYFRSAALLPRQEGASPFFGSKTLPNAPSNLSLQNGSQAAGFQCAPVSPLAQSFQTRRAEVSDRSIGQETGHETSAYRMSAKFRHHDAHRSLINNFSFTANPYVGISSEQKASRIMRSSSSRRPAHR